MLISGSLIAALVMVTSCNPKEPLQADYVPVAELERTYGRLISVANAPTPDQNGTGDLLGLFRDDGGTVWGIPLSVGSEGSILGCAPPMLLEAPVSDTIPADAGEIVGAANQPTGWRGGTGKLGLLFRNAQGALRWQLVTPLQLSAGPACKSRSEPVQFLNHYRLVKAGTKR